MAKSWGVTDASGSYDGRCRYSCRMPNWLTEVQNISWTCNMTRLTTSGIGTKGSILAGGSGRVSTNLNGRLYFLTGCPAFESGAAGGSDGIVVLAMEGCHWSDSEPESCSPTGDCWLWSAEVRKFRRKRLLVVCCATYIQAVHPIFSSIKPSQSASLLRNNLSPPSFNLQSL